MKQQHSNSRMSYLLIIAVKLQWQTHTMMHGSFWLLPLHLRDEQCTSLTQEHLISLRTDIILF